MKIITRLILVNCYRSLLNTTNKKCSESNNIEVISLEYIGGGCAQSINFQDEICDDSNGGPSTTDDAKIVCVSDDGSKAYKNNGVSIGEIFTVRTSGVDVTRCEVSDDECCQ